MIDTLPLLPDDRDGKFDSRYRVVLVAAQRRNSSCAGPRMSKRVNLQKKPPWLLRKCWEARWRI